MSQQQYSQQQQFSRDQPQQFGRDQPQYSQQGHTHNVSTSGRSSNQCKFSFDVNDTVMVLIDHQTGLLNLVRDMDVSILRTNVLTLAKAADRLGIPVVLTASDEEGPNGFLLNEFETLIPDALFVKRKGMGNPWENRDFVSAIEKFGKRTIIMAGSLTNVCLAGPAIAAACAGYNVYTVIDASGSTDKLAREIALHRLIFSSVIPIDTIAMLAEMLKSSPRTDPKVCWELLGEVMPEYKLLVDSFKCTDKAQQSQQSQQSLQSGKGLQGYTSPQQSEYPRYKDRKDQDIGYEKQQDVGYGKQQDVGYGKQQDVGYGKQERGWSRDR